MKAKIPILIFLGTMLALSFITGSVQGADCEDCHTSSSASGGWVYHPPAISLIHDPFYPPGSDLILTLAITGASDYEVRDITAWISIDGNVIELKDGAKGLPDLEGGDEVTWELHANEVGEGEIAVDIDYDVFYEHRTPGSKDFASYSTRRTTTIVVADLGLRITPGTLIFEESGQTKNLRLTAEKDVSNITIKPGPSVNEVISIAAFSEILATDDEIAVPVTLQNMTEGIYEILIEWVEEGQQKSISIEVKVLDPGDGGSSIDLLWEVGKYTGIAAFVLLVVGYFTGGSSPIKKTANKVFGNAKRRVDFHCNLSYLTLILVLVHFATLFYGPFRQLIFQWEVILGELALLIMIIVSVNGILQKKLIPLIGFQNWRRIHAWGSYLITVLVIVHMLLYGSHFLWFREMIGY